jgi:hypothetical protein
VDLRQAYDMSGTLSGLLTIDYRILVHGPCEVPPVIGKYEETWIAHGTFTGTSDGSAASGTLTYTARARSGGEVEGQIRLDGGLAGELAVSGNFADGKLSYHGRVSKPQREVRYQQATKWRLDGSSMLHSRPHGRVRRPPSWCESLSPARDTT